MYLRVPGSPSYEQQSSELVNTFAGQLRVEAEAIDSIRSRLRSAELLDWQSPAGRHFSGYLAKRGMALVVGAALLREAALSVEAYGKALAQAEHGWAAGL